MKPLIAVALICLLASASLAPAATPVVGQPPSQGEHDFGNKVLVVAFKEYKADGKEAHRSAYMAKVRVRKLGDQYFLVGEYPEELRNAASLKGAVLWMRLADVTSIWEFESVAAAEKMFEERERKQRN